MKKQQFKSIESRMAQFQAYHNRENQQPLFGFFLGSEYPLQRYPFSRNLPENRPLTPEDFDVDAFVQDTVALFAAHEECGGDFIFSGAPFWGIPWLEAMLGCPIYADHNTGSVYSKPPDWNGVESLPDFSPDSPWALLMTDMLDALSTAAAGRFPLATTRMRGVADLLSALYGGDAFLFAMMEKPEEVKAVANHCARLFIDCAKLQLQHIPEFHGGMGSFYYYMWVPPGTVWHQEDAAALLSPDFYKEFIEPCDRRIVDAFPHVVMHQHSTGYVPTDRYLKMGMSVLELHIDEGGPSAEELYERHLAILRERPLLIWGDIPEKDLDWLFNRLPTAGLAVITVVESAQKAQNLWRKYAQK
ncbi:MAG: hypothetical protein ACOC0L_02445 [bacterium]